MQQRPDPHMIFDLAFVVTIAIGLVGFFFIVI